MHKIKPLNVKYFLMSFCSLVLVAGAADALAESSLDSQFTALAIEARTVTLNEVLKSNTPVQVKRQTIRQLSAEIAALTDRLPGVTDAMIQADHSADSAKNIPEPDDEETESSSSGSSSTSSTPPSSDSDEGCMDGSDGETPPL